MGVRMWDTKVFTLIISLIIFWASTDVVQGRFIYHSEISRWVKQGKVVAEWEQAKTHCESEGAVLASPIKEDLFQYMSSIIGVDNHESPYFIGMKLIQDSDTYRSIEGTLLDDLPEAIINKIDKLDPREGECLGMSRNNIHVVPCWARLPYLCYLNTTTDSSSIYMPTTTSRPVTYVPQPTSNRPYWARFRTSPYSSTIPTSHSTQEATNCDYGFEYHHSGSCYKVHREYRSWDQARSICAAQGAYLAVINDADEAEHLKNITSQHYDRFARMWIGLRRTHYGGWRSVRGDDIDYLFNTWSDDAFGLPCGALKKDGLLDDQTCDFNYRFICEKSAQETPTSTSFSNEPRVESTSYMSVSNETTTLSTLCGPGYKYYSDSCYKVHEEYKSWDEAQSTCFNEGAYLTIINDANEAKYVKSITSLPNDIYIRKWIGLRKTGSNWLSVHGDNVEQIYHDWSYTVSGLECGVLKNDGLLDDQSCSFGYRFICEKSLYVPPTTIANTPRQESTLSSTRTPPTSTVEDRVTTPADICQSGYKYYSDSCYKVHEEYKSWDEAQSTCFNEGAYLTIINDANEAKYVKSITSLPNDEYIRKWIGLRNRGSNWLSVHGDNVEQIYHDWSDTVSGLECGVLKNDGLLDDQSCSFGYRFICEKSLYVPPTTIANTPRQESTPSSTRTPPTSTVEDRVTTPADICQAGYEFHSGSCYKVHDQYKSWDEAESDCISEGAYLAVINDANEANYLKSIAFRPDDKYPRKWIGLLKLYGEWRSAHGDSFDQIFNTWSSSADGSPCGALKKDGLLDDQTCGFKYRFICEKGVEGTTTPMYRPRYEPSYTSSSTTYQPPRPCGTGYEFHSGSCYRVHDEYKTWEEAKSTCASENGYLAIIDNADEARVLKSISSRPNDEYRRKWIGLHEVDGEWRTVHDNSLDDKFNVWSDSVSGLPCGAFKDDGLLDDQSCDFKYRFVCENHPYFY